MRAGAMSRDRCTNVSPATFRVLPIACIVLCCVSIFANATDVPIKKGMPFLSARKVLIKHGWKPNLTNVMEPGGVMKTLRDMGISEVERCTEGVQYCEFNYRKNKTFLVVSTTGEEVKNMIVDDWGFKCPEAE